MKRSILTTEQATWLALTLERNRQRFAGWSMVLDESDDAEADDGDDEVGDDGDDESDDTETDWKAKFEAQQRVNRNLERRGRKDAARIKQLEGKAPAEKPAPTESPDKIREEARAEAAREVLHARVEDKIEAKARAFADPEDAVAVLLRSHDINDFLDDDKIDIEAIADALNELGEKKPHLLAQGGQRFKGDPDGGARKETPGRPKSLGDAIANHYQPRR